MLVLTRAVNEAIMCGIDREEVFDEIVNESGIQALGQYQRKWSVAAVKTQGTYTQYPSRR